MASPAARRLTIEHRRAQEGITASVTEQLAKVWPLLDPERLEATTARWLAAALKIIAAHHKLSVTLSRRYYQAFRELETGEPFDEELPDPVFPIKAVVTSLMVNGPVRIRRGNA